VVCIAAVVFAPTFGCLGNVKIHPCSVHGTDDEASAKLWALSEKETGVTWDDVMAGVGTSASSTSATSALAEKPKKKRSRKVAEAEGAAATTDENDVDGNDAASE
jgi:hypothetical protein